MRTVPAGPLPDVGVDLSAGESSTRRAAERLAADFGLTFPASRVPILRRALATATREGGFASVEEFLDGIDRRHGLLDHLVSLVTIGETYFFRHPEQLGILSNRILPEMAASRARQDAGMLRAWSAGCSTGEEAYSLAILLAEIAEARPGTDFRVLGTDVDRRALQRARVAVYGSWSFRSELGERSRWFEEVDRGRRVSPEVAGRVEFHVDNLLAGAGVPPPLREAPDLILCRNVWLYLSGAARRHVAERFLGALAPGGWLVVGPVEVSSALFVGFEPVLLDGFTFYRRPVPRATGPRMTATATGARRVAAVRQLPPRSEAAGEARSADARPSRSPSPIRFDLLVEAGRLADAGLLGQARETCERAIRAEPTSIRAHVLRASIAEAEGDVPGAAAALRRAVYLDRADPALQLRLGLVEWRLGRLRPARGRLRTALRLVEERAPDETLDESGLTVTRLRSVAAHLVAG